jgi:hypothetical protein
VNSNLSPAQFNTSLIDHKTGTSSTVSRGVSEGLANLNAGMWRKADPARYGATVSRAKS